MELHFSWIALQVHIHVWFFVRELKLAFPNIIKCILKLQLMTVAEKHVQDPWNAATEGQDAEPYDYRQQVVDNCVLVPTSISPSLKGWECCWGGAIFTSSGGGHCFGASPQHRCRWAERRCSGQEGGRANWPTQTGLVSQSLHAATFAAKVRRCGSSSHPAALALLGGIWQVPVPATPESSYTLALGLGIPRKTC